MSTGQASGSVIVPSSWISHTSSPAWRRGFVSVPADWVCRSVFGGHLADRQHQVVGPALGQPGRPGLLQHQRPDLRTGRSGRCGRWRRRRRERRAAAEQRRRRAPGPSRRRPARWTAGGSAPAGVGDDGWVECQRCHEELRISGSAGANARLSSAARSGSGSLSASTIHRAQPGRGGRRSADQAIPANRTGRGHGRPSIPILQPRVHRSNPGRPRIETRRPRTATRPKMRSKRVIEMGPLLRPAPFSVFFSAWASGSCRASPCSVGVDLATDDQHHPWSGRPVARGRPGRRCPWSHRCSDVIRNRASRTCG